MRVVNSLPIQLGYKKIRLQIQENPAITDFKASSIHICYLLIFVIAIMAIESNRERVGIKMHDFSLFLGTVLRGSAVIRMYCNSSD